MRSTRLQLAVTVVAVATAAVIFAYLGLPPEGTIWDAARADDLALVHCFLDWGAPPDMPNAQGRTLMNVAAARGRKDLARLLLNHGADLEGGDQCGGSTPLHYAAIYGRTEIAQFLLAQGAHVNVRGKDGSTPLHVAALVGKKEVAQLLLDCGAAVNAVDIYGRTPLDRALNWKQSEVAELLRSRGGEPGKAAAGTPP